MRGPCTCTITPAQVFITKVRYINYGGHLSPSVLPPSFLRLTCDEQSILPSSFVVARDREQECNQRGTLSLWCASDLSVYSPTLCQLGSAGVALSILMYDHLLSFGDEVQYIWRRPVTSIKVLYVILRYSSALAELVYFQGETLLAYSCAKLNGLHITHSAKWIGNTFIT
jgi:hypothetical protein